MASPARARSRKKSWKRNNKNLKVFFISVMLLRLCFTGWCPQGKIFVFLCSYYSSPARYKTKTWMWKVKTVWKCKSHDNPRFFGPHRSACRFTLETDNMQIFFFLNFILKTNGKKIYACPVCIINNKITDNFSIVSLCNK